MSLLMIGSFFACSGASLNEEAMDNSPIEDAPVVQNAPEKTSFDDVLTTKKLLDKKVISAFAQTYNFHEGNGEVLVKVDNNPSAPAGSLGSDQVVLARDWIGSVRWHPVKMNQCVFEFHVPVNSLDPNPTRIRQKLAMDGVMNKADRLKIKTHMLARPMLWAEKHPMITFTSDRCASVEGHVELDGVLSIRGVSKPVKTKLSLQLLENGLVLEGELKFKHSDFGMKPYQGMLGLVSMKETLRISIHLDSRGL